MSHPSILIGYGAYGLRVLRGFLASAAARGALVWEEEGSVGSLNERRLQSLSLFWTPDKVGLREQQAPAGVAMDNSYELMDDLYSQIEMLEGSFQEIRKALAEGVDREKKRLLDARRHGESSMPGLDVIVVSQPTSQEVIGSVRDLMEPAMASLAKDPSFTTAQGNTLVNFIHILDFEDYWAPRMEPVRLALQRTMGEYEDAGAAGGQAVGRVYLFDGNTAAGRRSSDSRQQEVVLFLELMLLEGLRASPDARPLFERQNLKVPPVCSIGVRVVERSSGLLRRLAAAAFARNWLEYIGSTRSADHAEAPFNELIKPFRGELLAATVGESELRAAAAKEIDEIEKTLLALAPGVADWGERLRATATRQTEAAILRLSRLSGERSANLSRNGLKNFREELERAITSAMQERSPACTLGSVIDELQRLQDEFAVELSAAQPAEDPPVRSDAPFEDANRMQREYFLYCSRQVQTALLAARWWPRAAIIFAVAFSPVLLRGIADAAVNNPVKPWVQAPLGALLLGGVFWLFGRKTLQPLLDRTAARARGFYTDPERGRLSERVRQVARSASIAGRIEGYADLLVYGVKQHVLGALTAEFQRAAATLVQRRDEVQWLRAQVGEFLRSNEVDDNPVLPAFYDGRARSDVRFSLERSEDLEAVARSVPRTPDRFRELVGTKQLFAGWSRPHCDTFLYPLPFLDRLSEAFQDRLEFDEAEAARRAQQISTLLDQNVRVPVCFQWFATDSLPTPERGSLFPAVWRALPGVWMALTTAGFAKRSIETSNAERLYLFQCMLGIPANLLVRSE